MKRLSSINETHWGGMVKRSSGDVKRKQDMGNLDEIQWIDLGLPFLVADRFYETPETSLFTYYEAEKMFPENGNIRMFNEKEFNGFLKCCSLKQIDEGVQISGNGNSIVLPYMYRLDRSTETWLNGKKNDFGHSIGLLENDKDSGFVYGKNENGHHILLVKRERVDETHWGGMVKRSSGEVKRKEDEIDHLGRDEFVKWLMNTYEINPDLGSKPSLVKGETPSVKYIQIPLFMVGYKLYRLGVVYENDEMKEIDILAERDYCGEFIEKLCEKFHVTVSSRNGGLKITKDGRISNSICVEIIDTVMENTSKRIYDKVK